MAKKKNQLDKIEKNRELTNAFIDFLNRIKEDNERKQSISDDNDKAIKEEFAPFLTSEWTATNPVNKQNIKCGSDVFYAQLASKILDCFSKLPLHPDLPSGFLRHSALALSAYLEDLVSDLGVWLAIKKIYHNKYNGWLPFFDTSHEDYFNDDLNIEDIRLIIWINFVRTGQPEGRIFSPFSPAVELMAETCYEILIEAFDKAPKASRIRDFIKTTFAKRHYYLLRALSVWIGVDFPLTAVPFLRQQILSDAIELTEMYKESDFTMCYYTAECHVSWIKYCSFIGCSSMEILSVMAEDYGFPETAKLLKEIKVISPALYEIMERGKNFIKVRNVVDEEFLITLDSFKSTVQLNNVEGFLASIVKFGDSWYVNGSVNMFSQLPEKERVRLNLNFIPESIKEKVREFIRNHDGKKLFYCKSEKAVGKLLGFATPQLNDEDIESGFKAKNILLVLSDSGVPSIVPDVCQLFADPENKLYRKTADRDGSESLHLICSGVIPDDVAEYIQENHLLPNAAMFTSQGKEFGKKIVQENLRFLINFFKVNAVDVERLRTE